MSEVYLLTCYRCQLLILIVVGALTLHFWRCNRKADRGKMIIEGSAEFRYTL